MNIWIINHYAMPPKFETRPRTIMMAKYLQKAGHKTKVFSASTLHNSNVMLIEKRGPLFIEKNHDGIDFVHIKTSTYSGNGWARIRNMLEFLLRLRKVSKRIQEHPDVIVCDLGTVLAPVPYFMSKSEKAKFILEIRDLWPESIVEYKKLSRKNPFVKLLYYVEKWMYKRADKIVFTMEGGRDYIVDKGWDADIDMSKVYHINNGVDLDSFVENRNQYELIDDDLDDDKKFIVVYTGSIRLVNNVKSIVEAAKIIQESNLKRVKFLIFGEGDERIPLELYCKEKDIRNVIFKGQVNKKYIPYILSKSNLNILHFEQNSLKKYGGSMNKLFDYFASGKPTVSDCEFGYDLINRYEAGISTDATSPSQMAANILEFVNMEESKYMKYCSNALVAAKDYDYKVLMANFVEVISD